jgi:uncharacterized membrane protein (DUF4010 family)
LPTELVQRVDEAILVIGGLTIVQTDFAVAVAIVGVVVVVEASHLHRRMERLLERPSSSVMKVAIVSAQCGLSFGLFPAANEV